MPDDAPDDPTLPGENDGDPPPIARDDAPAPRRRPTIEPAPVRAIGDEPTLEPTGAGETYDLNATDGEPPGHAPIAPPPPAPDPRDWESTADPVAPVTPPVVRTERERPATRRDWSEIRALAGCNLVVFVASVCVMVLELTAARLIADDVGQSLHTWTSVIGVVLAGITVGNYLGGWLADRFDPGRLLPWLFLAASVTCAGVLVSDAIVGGMDRGTVGWQTWIVFVVSTLFLPPALALGTISPVVAALALKAGRGTGITVGSVYAWGALGSIVGTFLTGFYLVDHLGSRAIVWCTAGTLAGMAALLAARRWAFRAAVVLGWMQFLGTAAVVASATAENLASWGERVGAAASLFADEETGVARRGAWELTFSNVGSDIHQLGLSLGLRDDDPDEYHDESNYSHIRVGWTIDERTGDDVKYLRLDKLVHSYWNPEHPTRLYYDYERIYAGVTEAAIAQRPGTTSVALPRLPLGARPGDLPPFLEYEPLGGRLILHGGMTATRRRDAIRASAHADYLHAIDELRRLTHEPGFPSFAEVPLEEWPGGVAPPETLEVDGVPIRVRYDARTGHLKALEAIDDATFATLRDASSDAVYLNAIDTLFAETRRPSTLFIGGGGYVFPRWIEARMPGAVRIDVAELDPAVTRAVRSELGLPARGATRIDDHPVDGRRFVDDRLRENARLIERGRTPVHYDFVYGDAFNDFGIPWHLTTREFTEDVRSLMTDDGVYLLNVIDLFPRTEFPDAADTTTEVDYDGTFPRAMVANPPYEAGRTAAGNGAFAGASIERRNDDYRVDYRGRMSPVTRRMLLRDAGTPGPRALVERLFRETAHPFRGRVPAAIHDSIVDDQEWNPCPPPFEGFEVMNAGTPYEPAYVFGVRGVMSAALRTSLLDAGAGNEPFREAVDELFERTNAPRHGRFLGRLVHTLADVFPCVYVFSASRRLPSARRDTLVIVASRRPLDLVDDPEVRVHWRGTPFASREVDADGTIREQGLWSAVVGLSEGHLLTDDFAPVDTLLVPVFATQ